MKPYIEVCRIKRKHLPHMIKILSQPYDLLEHRKFRFLISFGGAAFVMIFSLIFPVNPNKMDVVICVRWLKYPADSVFYSPTAFNKKIYYWKNSFVVTFYCNFYKYICILS